MTFLFATDIYTQYASLSREELGGLSIQTRTGGRIIALRRQRNVFMTIRWGLQDLQIYIDRTSEALIIMANELNVGDIIEVGGVIMRTMRGELTVRAEDILITGRTQHNLELRRDFEINSEVIREINFVRNSELEMSVHTRSRMTQEVRQFLYSENFMEVETPILHEFPSGASARTFETFCEANEQNYHLRIAPETFLVRALSSGMNQIFEIGHNFRNEGISNRHQPEFSMLECYRAFADCAWAIDFTTTLLRRIGERFNCEALTGQYQTLTYIQALIRYGNYNQTDIDRREFLMLELQSRGQNANLQDTSLAMLQFMLFEHFDSLIMEPTFITHHPIEISPLARSIEGTPYTERFELFIGGRELANGFSQLIDLEEQRRRFSAQTGEIGDIMQADGVYLQSLEYGFPNIGGFGIGIDRLAMLVCNRDDIRQVVIFPITA